MFEENLYLMDKKTQQGPAGIVVKWSRGAPFKAKLQLDNSMTVQLALAQGVKVSGFLAIPTDPSGKPKVPVGIDTYIEFPKLGLYVRVADTGVVEAGSGVFKERQYSVEAVTALPG